MPRNKVCPLRVRFCEAFKGKPRRKQPPVFFLGWVGRQAGLQLTHAHFLCIENKVGVNLHRIFVVGTSKLEVHVQLLLQTPPLLKFIVRSVSPSQAPLLASAPSKQPIGDRPKVLGSPAKTKQTPSWVLSCILLTPPPKKKREERTRNKDDGGFTLEFPLKPLKRGTNKTMRHLHEASDLSQDPSTGLGRHRKGWTSASLSPICRKAIRGSWSQLA